MSATAPRRRRNASSLSSHIPARSFPKDDRRSSSKAVPRWGIDALVPLGFIDGEVVVNGNAIGSRGVALTAYPVAGAAGLQPRRLDVLAESGAFGAWLPRGRWLLVARTSDGAYGTLGPLAVNTGVETRRRERLLVDTRLPGTLGIKLRVRDIEAPLADESFQITTTSIAADLVGAGRLRGKPRTVLPWADVVLDRVAATRQRIDVTGYGLHDARRLDVIAGEFEDLGTASLAELPASERYVFSESRGDVVFEDDDGRRSVRTVRAGERGEARRSRPGRLWRELGFVWQPFRRAVRSWRLGHHLDDFVRADTPATRLIRRRRSRVAALDRGRRSTSTGL